MVGWPLPTQHRVLFSGRWKIKTHKIKLSLEVPNKASKIAVGDHGPQFIEKLKKRGLSVLDARGLNI